MNRDAVRDEDPPMGQLRKRRKEARPTEILNAALTVFARRGFHAANMDEIGMHAGVSKGTIYLYFDSKERLFLETVRSVLEPLMEQGESAARQWDGAISSLLQQVVFKWHRHITATPVGDVLKLVLTEEDRFPALALQAQTLMERAHAVVRTLIDRGVQSGELRPCDTNAMAQVVLAPLGFRELCRYSPESFRINTGSDTAYFSAYVDLVLRGLVSS